MSVTARLVARFPGYWTKNYFLAVAREADQVAVMTYDTGIYLPFLYGLLIAWTTRWSVRQGIDDLLIGVPTYAETKPGHLPYVENIGNALRGLKMGLAGLTPSERRKVGAAIYAEWTTSREEEEIFRRRWLGSLP